MIMNRALLVDLPIFLTVARQGTMTRAAAALNTVQSNISLRIQRLEEELGARLLVRDSRRLRLTPDGEALMPFALRLEELSREILKKFGQDDELRSGSIRIGAIETVAASRLVEIIGRFTRTHPSVDISVETGGTASLWEKILKSELDVAFVSRRANEPAFFEEKVFEDDLVVIARARAGCLADLIASGNVRLKIFVQRTGCSFTARLTDYLREAGVPKWPMHAVGTLEGVIGSVRAGGGIAVLPRSYLELAPGAQDLSLFDLPEKFRSVEIYLIVQRWKFPMRLVDAFVQSCLGAEALREKRPSRS
jgi:LysR family transcriptional regulator, cell division regulator